MNPASSLRTKFRAAGWVRAPCASSPATLDFLRHQREQLTTGETRPRPWHYHAMHNPWSPTAILFDSWGLLDVCQSAPLLDAVVELLGLDLILCDSHWLPDPSDDAFEEMEWQSDATRLPVTPLVGLTALLVIAEEQDSPTRISYRSRQHQRVGDPTTVEETLKGGDIVLLDAHLHYRIQPDSVARPQAYAIRYFPATSTYNRDPTADVHRALTRRYPLLNYARQPLWLVRGEDRANNDFVTGFGTRAGFWAQVGG